ncbi:MAG: hypothetical protein AB7N80_14865 [Bdellovibrionales bacterium]
MAQLKSKPTTLKVFTPGNSTLAKLAASMPAGSWAQLTPANNQNAFVGAGTISGTMIHYCNSMPWNPKARAIEILAMDHAYGSLRYVRYNEPTNQFELMANDVGMGSFTQHGYDHVNIDPLTGDLYYRPYSVNTGLISCYKKPLGSMTFSPLPTHPSDKGSEQAAIGTCWWSGTIAGGGSKGHLIVFNSGNAVSSANDGQICGYNPTTNTWFFNQVAMAPNYGSGSTYHSVIEYSPIKNVAVYGGGNVATNRLWRLNADRTFVAMPNVPAGKGVGMQQGIICADPVTGNFILLSAGQLWELNPDGAGSWAQLNGGRQPPAGVGSPGPGTPDGLICCPIPDYGVIAYIKQTSMTGGTFYLYKHA